LPSTQTAQPDDESNLALDKSLHIASDNKWKSDGEIWSQHPLLFTVKRYKPYDLISCPSIYFGLVSEKFLNLILEFGVMISYSKVVLREEKTGETYTYFVLTDIPFQEFIDSDKSNLKKGIYIVKQGANPTRAVFRDRFNWTSVFCCEKFMKRVIEDAITGLIVLPFDGDVLNLFAK
jgi:hypothetical protein